MVENINQQNGKKFFAIPQTEEEIKRNKKIIEELRDRGVLQKYEKTFKIKKDETVIEEG